MLVSKCSFCFTLILLSALSHAEEALVAVATNFAHVARQLELSFEQTTGHRVTISSGSTGKLYTQIINGAPFDILLAADHERPILLEESGLGVEGTRFTYAFGRLALVSADANQLRVAVRESIEKSEFAALAIANPALAPYGVAAREVLRSLHLWNQVQDRLVMGENVGQAYALIATGNAELGLVSLSLVQNQRTLPSAAYIEVSSDLHEPIRQDALLLSHGKEKPAARAFLEYLRQAQARAIVAVAGYEVAN